MSAYSRGRWPQYNLYNASHIDGARKTQNTKKSNFHKETKLQSEVKIKVNPLSYNVKEPKNLENVFKNVPGG